MNHRRLEVTAGVQSWPIITWMLCDQGAGPSVLLRPATFVQIREWSRKRTHFLKRASMFALCSRNALPVAREVMTRGWFGRVDGLPLPFDAREYQVSSLDGRT